MESNKTRSRLMFALGAAILVGAILLMVPNAAGGVFAVGPPPPSQGPVLQQGPTRPPPLEPLPPRTGHISPEMDLSHLTGQRMPEGMRAADLPDIWDWRTQNGGKVTSVKNQGASCGSCYAFAAIGNIESKMLIDGAGSYDFSENNAKECAWNDPSCAGGNYRILANLFSQKGVVLESCDPYQASDVACTTTCTYQKTLLGWKMISGNVVPDTDVLKGYIYANAGPVQTALYADGAQGFDISYDGSFTFNYTKDPGDYVNHDVLIVGWSNNLPPVPGGTDPADGWIVKNSWGAGWGDNGYFYMTYDAANIGMDTAFMYTWQDYDSDGDIMYYDEAGWMNTSGFGTTTAWGLVKFIPTSDTNVTRVEFWTTERTTDIDVYIYDDFDGTAPSNPLWSSLDHSFDEAGYHGVVVDPPLPVTNGDDVIAMVKFTSASYPLPIPADQNGPSETGRTYISCDGSDGSWTDLGAYDNDDVAIRLRTSGIAPIPTSQLLQNPGFETGSWDPWRIWGSSTLTSTTSHSGSWSAHMGNYDDAHDEIFQWVDIPADATNVTIDFWAQLRTDETFAEADYFCYDIWDQAWTTAYVRRCFDLGSMGDVDWAEEIYSLTPDELANVAGQTVAFLLMFLTNDSLPSRV